MIRLLAAIALSFSLASPVLADFQSTYAAQLKLKSLGYDVGKPDGAVGPRTRAALKQAAEDLGFEPTVDGLTRHFVRDTILNRIALEDGPMLDAIKENVAADLKDPGSAQFREMYQLASGNICGEVNGKNSYGAYAGFTRFYASKPINANGTWIATLAFIASPDNTLPIMICTLDIVLR